MDRVPFAASVRGPAPEPDRAQSFNMSDAEGPDEFRLSDGDEEARQARLSAPPRPKPEVTAEERARLVSGCVDAIMAWSASVYRIGDILVRCLAEEAGVTPEEADALVSAEAARRRGE